MFSCRTIRWLRRRLRRRPADNRDPQAHRRWRHAPADRPRRARCGHRETWARTPAVLSLAGCSLHRRDTLRCAAGTMKTVVPCANFALDSDLAPRLMRKSEDLAEAEPGTLADRLGREKRLEDPLENVVGHAAAGVGHPTTQIFAGPNITELLSSRVTFSVEIVSAPRRPWHHARSPRG